MICFFGKSNNPNLLFSKVRKFISTYTFNGNEPVITVNFYKDEGEEDNIPGVYNDNWVLTVTFPIMDDWVRFSMEVFSPKFNTNILTVEEVRNQVERYCREFECIYINEFGESDDEE